MLLAATSYAGPLTGRMSGGGSVTSLCLKYQLFAIYCYLQQMDFRSDTYGVNPNGS